MIPTTKTLCVCLLLLGAGQSWIPLQQQQQQHRIRSSSAVLFAKRTNAAKQRLISRWYPNRPDTPETMELEQQSLQLITTLLQQQLPDTSNSNYTTTTNTTTTTVTSNDTTTTITNNNNNNPFAYSLARHQFQDLCQTLEGSRVLENLFYSADTNEEDIIWGAIYALQSLCIMGMMVGVTLGTPAQQMRRVQHMTIPLDNYYYRTSGSSWISRLKYNADVTAGTQLLALLKSNFFKRNSEGAQSLLQTLGAWHPHDSVALLRSGFPIVIDPTIEEKYRVPPDWDEDFFQIRRDLTSHKVYTIDDVGTTEVDDGLSVVKDEEDGSLTYWIHIADAHRWCTPELYQLAQDRIVTHYLPTGSIPMFPTSILQQMSLNPQTDNYNCALSLGVKLDETTGEILNTEVCLSKIKVAYQLSYDAVNEMLAEGVAYAEEWELGQLLNMARILKQKRIRKGSTESRLPYIMPSPQVKVNSDSGNISITLDGGIIDQQSEAKVLVTEFMVLAGEALGQWKFEQDTSGYCGRYQNTLSLLYRRQDPPSFQTKPRSVVSIYEDLTQKALEEAERHPHAKPDDTLPHKLGFCQAWYGRRFLTPAKVVVVEGDEPTENLQHAGLGLEQYVQWTSPIRRLGDLQVHASVKRYLRRQRVQDWMYAGVNIEERFRHDAPQLGVFDLGCPVPGSSQEDDDDVDDAPDYVQGTAMVAASRKLQRETTHYWLYEYLRLQQQQQQQQQQHNETNYKALVLGCTNRDKNQYAIYLPSLGLEHKILLGRKKYAEGTVLTVRVESVNPIQGLLTLTKV